jgi:hypothetical protein
VKKGGWKAMKKHNIKNDRKDVVFTVKIERRDSKHNFEGTIKFVDGLSSDEIDSIKDWFVKQADRIIEDLKGVEGV